MMGFVQDLSTGIGQATKAATKQLKLENRSDNLKEKQNQLAARKADIENKYKQTLDRQTQKQQALQEKEASLKSQYDQKMQRDQDMAAKAAEKSSKEKDLRTDIGDWSKPVKEPAPRVELDPKSYIDDIWKPPSSAKPMPPSMPTSFSPMNPSSAVEGDLGSAMKTMGMKRGGNVQTTRMSTVQRSKKSSNW